MNADTCDKILVTGGGISFNPQTHTTTADSGNVMGAPPQLSPKSANSKDYYCEVCETSMTGAVTYECHLAGARHLKNVENMKIGAPRDTGSMKRKPKGVLPEVTGTRPGRAIFPATKAILDSCTKPLIGMSFITECQVSDGNFEPRYLCQLCQGKCDPRTLLSHILGGKHRIAYFKEKYPDHYNEVFKDKSLRKSEVTPIIEKCALLVEKAEGRQSMKTIIDNDIIENCFTKTRAGTDVPFGGNRGRGNGTSSRGFGSPAPRGRGQSGGYNGSGGSRRGEGRGGGRGGFSSSRGQGNGSSGRGQRGGGGQWGAGSQRGGYSSSSSSSRGQKEFRGRGQVRGSHSRGQRAGFSQSPRGGYGRGRGQGQTNYEDYRSDGYYDKGYSDSGYADTGYGDSGYDTGYGDASGTLSGSQWYDESYYREPGFGKYPSARSGYAGSGYAEHTPRYRPYPRSEVAAEPYRRPYSSAPLLPPRPAPTSEASDSAALLSLTKCLVSNEQEAKAALQISNKLAEALLEYHRSKESTQSASEVGNVAANPQTSMSSNVPALGTGQMGVGQVKTEAYAAPQVDYNHGYTTNMDYAAPETTDASAVPYTGGYGYAQPW